tara:strand:- start:340 stop:480 length:141 start_codon:yes stop_codon:yes gene_type:complete
MVELMLQEFYALLLRQLGKYKVVFYQIRPLITLEIFFNTIKAKNEK